MTTNGSLPTTVRSVVGGPFSGPDMPKRRLITSSIDRLFPNRALLEVLSLLLLHPTEDFYQSEIVRRSGHTLLQVQRALRRIEDAGLAHATRRGNRVYYTANQAHPVYEDLKGLVLKTVAFGDALRDGLEPMREKILMACIFGSVASGSEGPASDVDLLVVGDVSSRKLAGVIGPLARRLNREVNQLVYTPQEFRKRIAEGDRFVSDLIAGQLLWLIGDRDVLTGMVE